jgi:uncharacterized protein with NAD-binding domain and iron-sulfur cluster
MNVYICSRIKNCKMPKIVILGGGVAGMSAAHELINRGFEVDVYDRNPTYVGGKARSVNVPGTNTQDPDLYLPGEHGFRFFPGFYKHVTQTMGEIPFGKSTVLDNLVDTDDVAIFQNGHLPITVPLHIPNSLKDVVNIFKAFMVVNKELTLESVEFFAGKIWQLMTSCVDRFENEYEQISWWEYTGADNYNEAYRSLLVEGLTRSLVAAQAQKASTRTVGTVFLQLIYTMLKSSNTDRVLNAPTNDAWLTPWINYLKDKGVNYNLGHTVKSIQVEEGINGSPLKNATIQVGNDVNNTITVSADYFILATPVEVAATLINPDVLAADQSLVNIIKLAPNVEWMNGIQFYLNESFPMHHGHTIYANSNWALTSISQQQFWGDYDYSKRYDGTVKGVLSVDISDWNAPGNINGKKASECSLEEVKTEVWEQLKQEINLGKEVLTDDMLRFVYLDADIFPTASEQSSLKSILGNETAEKVQKLGNKEPLLVNQVNTWTLRPNSVTNIPNLFLASDYVKTNTNLATMEGANEAAKRAVNNILKMEKRKDFCDIFPLKQPLLLGVFQKIDKTHWNKGLSWNV